MKGHKQVGTKEKEPWLICDKRGDGLSLLAKAVILVMLIIAIKKIAISVFVIFLIKNLLLVMFFES